jgi:histidinol-phosphate/aromatic aminotransferase/cobyric acid decarboxylase-like protein
VAKEIEKSRGPYMVTSLGEAAAVKVLRDEEGWVARTVAECLDCRGRLIQELDARGLTPLPTAANFVMIPVGEGCALRYAQGLRRMGVRVRPFPAMPDLGDGIRVTVGPWPLMERFLEALDQVIAADEPASHVQVEVEQPRKATAL